ncbi:MAG: hypothetical protein KTQ49_00140 [Candidatus Omnitrophica bacterium]|nr:hypothetical protein [Candidatus Omnitrophota bacterium]
MKKHFWVLTVAAVWALGAGALGAAETAVKPNAVKQILDVQKRGFINIVTCLGETARVVPIAKEEHPKAWLAAYPFYAFGNTFLRLGSGINDLAILPFYVNVVQDPTPITTRMDLPEYFWSRE